MYASPARPLALLRSAGFPAGLACVIFSVTAAQAEKPLPFPPEWTETVEATFFEADGTLSATKLAAYRSQIEQRQREVRAILTAEYRERGKSRKSIKKRLRKKKLMRVYAVLLGDDEREGLIDLLGQEPDPVRARRLASQTLEIDYALRVEGERPFSLNLVDYLSWAWIFQWVVESSPGADAAEREASNLWNPETGQFYDTDDLEQLYAAGGDLSALGPPPDSSFWRPGVPIAERSVRAMFYDGGTPLHRGARAHFPHRRAELKKIRLTQTKPKFEIEVGDPGSRQTFKLKLGGEIHSEPTVNALLATLGFNVDLTHYVHDFRLDLPSDLSVEQLRNDWRSYFENHRVHNRFAFDDYFVEGEDEQGRFLIIREGLLEWKPPDIIRVGPWPFGGNGNEGLREVRALALFSVWVGNTDLKEAENNKLALRKDEPVDSPPYHVHHDLGHSLGRMIREQLGAFPWDLVEPTESGKTRLRYHSVQPNSLRTMMTYADARWMAREIAQLTKEQIARAVAIGHWPRAAAALLTEKLANRRNQLVTAFDLVGAATPSGPIELLEVDRHLTTDDGAVVDGEFVTGRFEGSTQEFDSYWKELLGPVWDRVVLFVMAQVQRSVSAVPEIVFDERSVGFPKGLVAEVLLNFKRTTSENDRPTSSRDYYVTRDSFVFGVRVGGGFVARAEVALARRYALITPAGTQTEAQYANGTIFNLLLPWQVHQGDLPEEYVLVREDYLEGRGRLITDDISGGSAVAGSEFTLGRVRLSRDVVSVKPDHVRAYHDLSGFDQTAFRAFLKAVFVRIPLASVSDQRGDRKGHFYDLTEALAAHPEPTSTALEAFIRSGRLEPLDAVADRVAVESEYRYHERNAGLLDFISSRAGVDQEDVALHKPLDPQAAPDRFEQIRVYQRGSWRFLDLQERHSWNVHAVTPHGAATASTIHLLLKDEDSDTWSSELGDSYLHFINTIASSGDAASKHLREIAFTPELHSANRRWGHLNASVEVTFAPEAVDALIQLEPERYWRRLARTLDLDEAALRRQRAALQRRGKPGMIARRAVPVGHRSVIRQSLALTEQTRRARAATDAPRRNEFAVKAVAASVIRRGGGFDPRILSTLRALLGADDISVDARITQPVWKEKRLLGGEDLVLHTHREPIRSEGPEPILFAPRSPLQTYRMLESFEAAVESAPPGDAAQR